MARTGCNILSARKSSGNLRQYSLSLRFNYFGSEPRPRHRKRSGSTRSCVPDRPCPILAHGAERIEGALLWKEVYEVFVLAFVLNSSIGMRS